MILIVRIGLPVAYQPGRYFGQIEKNLIGLQPAEALARSR